MAAELTRRSGHARTIARRLSLLHFQPHPKNIPHRWHSTLRRPSTPESVLHPGLKRHVDEKSHIALRQRTHSRCRRRDMRDAATRLWARHVRADVAPQSHADLQEVVDT